LRFRGHTSKNFVEDHPKILVDISPGSSPEVEDSPRKKGSLSAAKAFKDSSNQMGERSTMRSNSL